jgi:superfamily II DNA helicase RecQ
MAYKIFCRTIPSDEPTEEELNRFLATHRVVSVQQQWVNRDGIPYLVFAVEYLPRLEGGVLPPGIGGDTGRIDYQKVLKPDDFKKFAALRDLRRALAEAEGVKPFVIFTNAQLALMVTGKVDSLAALGRIDGVGEARLQKYGKQCLAVLLEMAEKTTAETLSNEPGAEAAPAVENHAAANTPAPAAEVEGGLFK